MKERRGGGEGEERKRLQTNPPPGSEQRRAIFFRQRMRWFPGMFCHDGPSSLVFFFCFFCGVIKILSDTVIFRSKFQRMDCTLNLSYIIYGELYCKLLTLSRLLMPCEQRGPSIFLDKSGRGMDLLTSQGRSKSLCSLGRLLIKQWLLGNNFWIASVLLLLLFDQVRSWFRFSTRTSSIAALALFLHAFI